MYDEYIRELIIAFGAGFLLGSHFDSIVRHVKGLYNSSIYTQMNLTIMKFGGSRMKIISVSKSIWKQLNAMRTQQGFNNNNQVISLLLDNHNLVPVVCDCGHEFFLDSKTTKSVCPKCGVEGTI